MGPRDLRSAGKPVKTDQGFAEGTALERAGHEQDPTTVYTGDSCCINIGFSLQCQNGIVAPAAGGKVDSDMNENHKIRKQLVSIC